jgi:hypothetical protein
MKLPVHCFKVEECGVTDIDKLLTCSRCIDGDFSCEAHWTQIHFRHKPDTLPQSKRHHPLPALTLINSHLVICILKHAQPLDPGGLSWESEPGTTLPYDEYPSENAESALLGADSDMALGPRLNPLLRTLSSDDAVSHWIVVVHPMNKGLRSSGSRALSHTYLFHWRHWVRKISNH